MKFTTRTRNETMNNTIPLPVFVKRSGALNKISAKKLRMLSFPVAAFALASIVASPTASAASSSAFGVRAQFTAGDLSMRLGPLDSVRRSAPPGSNLAYNQTVPMADVNRVVVLPAGPATLSVGAAELQTNVKGDGSSSDGDAALQTVNLTLTLPDDSAPLLAVSATGVLSHAHYNDQVRLPDFTGNASFDNLTVSGSLIENQFFAFSGPAPRNQILYQSPTVVITLNKETEPELISCQTGTPGCSVTPTSIMTEALDISLHNVSLNGQVVSGEIVVGYSSAQQ